MTVPSCRLDTRSKIIGMEEALTRVHGQAGWVVVTGYFDPVTAEHARRLREIRAEHSGIVVFVSDPRDPVLPARARAELLAAMRMVDYVVLPQERASFVSLPPGSGVPVLREEEADEARLRNLIRRVYERHRAAAER